jgi:hypothetical protein
LSFSPEIKSEYHGILDDATKMFRSAGAEFEKEKKLLLPYYTLCEVGTSLLNGKAEVAKYTAQRCIIEYKAQESTFETIQKTFSPLPGGDTTSDAVSTGLFSIFLPVIYPFHKLNEAIEKPARGEGIDDLVKNMYKAGFNPNLRKIYNRVETLYDTNSSQNIQKNCEKLLGLRDNHAIFNLLSPST